MSIENYLSQLPSVFLSAADLVKDARINCQNLSPVVVHEEIENGEAILIDIRETEELQRGKIPGAIHAPRGMLEFFADASLPYHKPEFTKENRLILYCASSGRSALAVQTLKKMGYLNVAHIDGGIKAWQSEGLPIE